ncbi:MAG TPA: hypothetical protein VJU84_02185 [Pyrinomonadaceae bacterium]|nr:hypothetical protein [Pyrinomonadaceae bacterium]
MRDKKKEPEPEKQPIDMTTDEALEYVFGSELTAELKKEVRQFDDPECEQNDE